MIEKVMTNDSASKFDTILKKVDPTVLAVAIVNLKNLAQNYRSIQNEVSACTEVAAVVKADAYGFGATAVANKLHQEGCRKFFVATIEEGLQLRAVLPLECEIFILSGLFAGTENILSNSNLIPVINCEEQAFLWINHAKAINERLKAVIHIDTGMSRNGFHNKEFDYNKLLTNLDIRFIMSHLACADSITSSMNDKQLQRFLHISNQFPGIAKCFSATNGIFLGHEYQFDIVRPGKALYGFSIRPDKLGSLLPVMDIFARIVQVNHLQKGDTIGYGSTFTAPNDMTTVTIGMGYADGFMRKFSGFGHGFLGGKKMPMIGRISMDYIVLDASDVEPEFLTYGGWVALTNSTDYTLERWALLLDTLPHEIACRFGSRVKRIYVEM